MASSFDASLRATLQRIIWLRHFTVTIYLLSMLAGILLFKWQFPWLPLGLLYLALLASSGITRWWLQDAKKTVTPTHIAGQLTIDILGHSVWLFLLGGATNPFTAWFLLPLTIAAATLQARYVWSLTVFTILLYSALFSNFQPLPTNEPEQAFFLHVFGMWLAFVSAAVLVASVVAAIGRQLRQNQQALAVSREAALRQQQVMGLAVQAAGAAHRLSTPLATLTILVDELLAEQPSAALEKDLRVMQLQLQACRAELNRLRASDEPTARLAADEAILHVLEDWRVIRPTGQMAWSLRGTGPVPNIATPFAIRQAIMNILDNAADASPDWQSLTLRWEPGRCWLKIEDQGAGFDGRVGPSSEGGLGVGVALTISAIEAAGGTITWQLRSSGGTCVRITLPTSPE